jgi:DNA-binding response OmpR family regulator
MKILLVDYNSKIGKESLPYKLTELGFVVDKISKTDSEEVKELLSRGKYDYLFISIGFEKMRRKSLEMVKDLRKTFPNFPIVGLLNSEKNNLNKSVGFTEVLTNVIEMEKLKEILNISRQDKIIRVA